MKIQLFLDIKKLEDKFVDMFLRNDDETIEEAKERVKKEQKELEERNIKLREEQLERTRKIVEDSQKIIKK